MRSGSGVKNTFVDITYFETDLGCWKPDDPANWTLTSGSVVTSTTSASLTLVTSTSHPTIEVGLAVTTDTPTTVTPKIWAELDFPQSSDWCQLNLFDPGRFAVLHLQPQDLTTVDIGDLTSTTHRMIHARDGQGGHCAMEGHSLSITDPATVGATTAILHSQDMATAFSYVIVYGR